MAYGAVGGQALVTTTQNYLFWVMVVGNRLRVSVHTQAVLRTETRNRATGNHTTEQVVLSL